MPFCMRVFFLQKWNWHRLIYFIKKIIEIYKSVDCFQYQQQQTKTIIWTAVFLLMRCDQPERCLHFSRVALSNGTKVVDCPF